MGSLQMDQVELAFLKHSPSISDHLKNEKSKIVNKGLRFNFCNISPMSMGFRALRIKVTYWLFLVKKNKRKK